MSKYFMFTCQKCKKELPISNFFEINDIIFPTGVVPICMNCLKTIIAAKENDFSTIDRILQYMGIPFIIDKWLHIQSVYKDKALEIYVKMYKENKFPYIDWSSAYHKFKELEDKGDLEQIIPQFSTAQLNALRTKWGEEYTDEKELYQLEKLYQGILNTYSIFGENQMDQVRKLCKISLMIDNKIRAGEDFDKLVKSYNDFQKAANLAPKNIKNANDFGSCGEIFAYLEKDHNWLNKFYDGVKRDIVDKTMEDIQNWSRNFYINESSIPQEVETRIKALQTANELEDKLNAIEDDGLDDSYFEEDINDFLEDFDPNAGV